MLCIFKMFWFFNHVSHKAFRFHYEQLLREFLSTSYPVPPKLSFNPKLWFYVFNKTYPT